MLNHLVKEIVMLRSLMFAAIAAGVTAIGPAVTPAAALPSQSYGDLARHIPPHLHPVTSPGKTMFRPPSKKKPG